MDYSRSWTSPGQGYSLINEIDLYPHGLKINNKPDNPKDRVGSAVDRHQEYAYIYIDGLSKDLAKRLQKEFAGMLDGKEAPWSSQRKWLDKEAWGKMGKQRNDVQIKGSRVIITNSKLKQLGRSQVDITMVSRNIAKWIASYGPHKGTIGSVLNSQR